MLPRATHPELRAIGIRETQKSLIVGFPDAQEGFASFVGVGADIGQFGLAWRTHGARVGSNSEMDLNFGRKLSRKALVRKAGRMGRRYSGKSHVGANEQTENGVVKIQGVIETKPTEGARES